MARFARDCLRKFKLLIEKLEVLLGPETSDLAIRFGLHSGPVTAGVLRGERSRFQLFGDTMNTTARIEANGKKNKIHLSSETASFLTAAGKSHWIRLREDKIFAKGKGELTTYWLEFKGDQRSSISGSSVSLQDEDQDVKEDNANAAPAFQPEDKLDAKIWRLVDWNKDILAKLLKEIVAVRKATRIEPDDINVLRKLERPSYISPIAEMQEIIILPDFDPRYAHAIEDAHQVELGGHVIAQLREYLGTIAASYNKNAFHNFEHASHVTMSVVKLLSRIVTLHRDMEEETTTDPYEFHKNTFGITSDPLTQFALVLSAIIHDVDHPGVPNVQLVKERAELAVNFGDKSPAEQHAICLAWDLLMESRFDELRRTIYATKAEYRRFRQLIVNCVMATDVMDKDLNTFRKARWEKAFSDTPSDEPTDFVLNRKATVVIEHLIQASDVAHLMQHWHVFRKWNEYFFQERRKAFRDGRAECDPADDWYEGEIGFLDHYIIPLARKLKDCGVFGVSSDEYLAYAEQNRKEWEGRGRDVLTKMIEADNKENGIIFERVRLDV